jgi:uncharacterized protein
MPASNRDGAWALIACPLQLRATWRERIQETAISPEFGLRSGFLGRYEAGFPDAVPTFRGRFWWRKEVPMATIKDATTEFLAHKRVAVTGVSRTPKNHGSNVVYKRLRERGYEVFAVNPNAEEVEGDKAFRDLRAIPGGVQAVVIGTRPEFAEATMRECVELGIKHVWMHRGPGGGSVSDTATAYGRERGISVIDGGCPCMFGPTADAGHKAMRVIFTLTGNVPKRV